MKRTLKMIITALLIAGVIFAAIFAGLQGKKREVKNLIITYNQVLQKTYEELNASRMENFTSEAERKKIDNYMVFLYKQGKMFKGEIKDIRFDDIKVEEHSAVVVTTERWVYTYVDPTTKQPVSGTFDEKYGNTYYLLKIDRRWVVDSLTSNKIEVETSP